MKKASIQLRKDIVFVGTTDEKNTMINVILENPNEKESYFIGARSNSQGVFETTAKKY